MCASYWNCAAPVPGPAVNKFKRMLAYASPVDDRIRGTLRMYGAGPGRWAGLGPQLQNLKKNESNLPLDCSRSSFASVIAAASPRYWQSAGLAWGCLARCALRQHRHGAQIRRFLGRRIGCAGLVEPGRHWKLLAYKTYQANRRYPRLSRIGSSPARCYRSRRMRRSTTAERQLGKGD